MEVSKDNVESLKSREISQTLSSFVTHLFIDLGVELKIW
jgi:hypothetical protein